MTTEQYQQYLNSGIWRRIKKRKLACNQECHRCGWDKQLNVHHLSYERVGGREFDGDLEVLCRRCHWEAHRTIADELEMLVVLGYTNRDIQKDLESDPDFIIIQKQTALIQELKEAGIWEEEN